MSSEEMTLCRFFIEVVLSDAPTQAHRAAVLRWLIYFRLVDPISKEMISSLLDVSLKITHPYMCLR